MTACECAQRFHVSVGRTIDYDRAKRLLDAGRHPAFIGRSSVSRWADQGGLLFFVHNGSDVAVAMISPRTNTLMVLNVHPAHRSHGLGAKIIDYVMPNFARVIESAVPWFEHQGYIGLGEWKMGRKFRTRIMVSGSLHELAGRVKDHIGGTCQCHKGECE